MSAEVVQAKVERTADLAPRAATLRAERDAALAEVEQLRAKVARLARHIDDGLRIVNALAEEVGNECQPEDGVCHEHDLTDEGECPLVVDLERASAALQGSTRTALADPAPVEQQDDEARCFCGCGWCCSGNADGVIPGDAHLGCSRYADRAAAIREGRQ